VGRVSRDHLVLKGLVRALDHRIAKVAPLQHCCNAMVLRGVIQLSGQDHLQRPIVVIAAKRIPPNTSMQALLDLVNEQLKDIALRDYAVVYCHSLANINFNMFSSLANLYATMPREFRKNLKALYIVHPTFWVRSFMTFMYPFISQKFWKKLFYVIFN
jgi:Rho GTPase-activating protein 1